MIDQLRAEIERRVLVQHSQVIINALAQLDEVGLPSVCTYYALFQRYKTYHSNITRLSRAGRLYESDLGYDDDVPEIDHRLAHYLEQIDNLRPQRYVNVCGNCPACRTRRKRWPEISGET